MTVTAPPRQGAATPRLPAAVVRDFWDRCLHDVCTTTHLPEVGVEGLAADADRLVDLAVVAGAPYAPSAAQGAAAGIGRALNEAWAVRAQSAFNSLVRPRAPLPAPPVSPRLPEPVASRLRAAHRVPTPGPVRERHPAGTADSQNAMTMRTPGDRA